MLLTKTIVYIVFASVAFLGACENDKIVTPDDEINPEVERVVGFYKATTFTEPGDDDSGVDIGAEGGVVVAQLHSDLTVEGYYFIPENIGTNFAPRDMLYKGTFSLDNDTLRFKDTDVTVLDEYPYMVHADRLEMPQQSGRLSLLKVIMEKQ